MLSFKVTATDNSLTAMMGVEQSVLPHVRISCKQPVNHQRDQHQLIGVDRTVLASFGKSVLRMNPWLKQWACLWRPCGVFVDRKPIFFMKVS